MMCTQESRRPSDRGENTIEEYTRASQRIVINVHVCNMYSTISQYVLDVGALHTHLQKGNVFQACRGTLFLFCARRGTLDVL